MRTLRPLGITIAIAGAWLAIGGVANGTDGQPLIAGQLNTATTATTISVAAEDGLQVRTTQGDGSALYVSQPGDGEAVSAHVGPGGNSCALCGYADAGSGKALSVVGPSAFNGPVSFQHADLAIVPAGSSSVVVNFPELTATERVIATLEDFRGTATVVAAVPKAKAGTITIHLSRVVKRPTRVAWFAFE
jgi:hypothetical protein